MTRTGKIARLPREVRDELNQRLQDGEPARRLVEWLNGLERVKEVVATGFEGRAITEQNLSDWKLGGYQDWCAQQEVVAGALELAADASELAEANTGAMANQLTKVLTAKYAMLLKGWNGTMDAEFHNTARTLRTMCLDVAELRRAELAAERLDFEQRRWLDDVKSDLDRAMDMLATNVAWDPELRKAHEAFRKLCEQRMLKGQGAAQLLKVIRAKSC